jgi:hypothetical protein
MDKISCWDQFGHTLKQAYTKKLHEPQEKEMFFLIVGFNERKRECSFDYFFFLA